MGAFDDLLTETDGGYDCSHGNVIQGDTLSVLLELPENEFHAIVCDPPYNFDGGFMQQEWDDIGSAKEYQQWCQEWADKALTTLKPGGHLIAFSGNRSHHRLMSGVEDAGYEIRDTITWHYGEGFTGGSGQRVGQYLDDDHDMSEWRYGLKPATEFAVLARAPFSGSTTSTVREHDTAVINVPETRIGEAGRYPNNVTLDAVMADVIDMMGPYTEGGEKTLNADIDGGSGEGVHEGYQRPEASSYTDDVDEMVRSYGDEGGPSRFFYCSKSKHSSSDVDHPTVKPIDLMEWLVKMVTAEGQKVLDPFVGSGTTMVAAENVGRECVGIEMEEEYVELAEQRFSAVAD